MTKLQTVLLLARRRDKLRARSARRRHLQPHHSPRGARDHGQRRTLTGSLLSTAPRGNGVCLAEQRWLEPACLGESCEESGVSLCVNIC
jgi:hypothetical protein